MRCDMNKRKNSFQEEQASGKKEYAREIGTRAGDP